MTFHSISVLLILAASASAFQTPRMHHTRNTATMLGAGTLLPETFLIADDAVVAAATDPSMLQQAGGVLQTVAAVITGLIFFFAAVAFLYASFIIPAAAEQLEKECKELQPGLWEEYVAQLNKGETMAQRPDLMQELGTKLQPFLEDKLKKMDDNGELSALQSTLNPMPRSTPAQQEEPPVQSTVIPTMNQWDDDGPAGTGVVDATIVSKKDVPETGGGSGGGGGAVSSEKQ